MRGLAAAGSGAERLYSCKWANVAQCKCGVGDQMAVRWRQPEWCTQQALCLLHTAHTKRSIAQPDGSATMAAPCSQAYMQGIFQLAVITLPELPVALVLGAAAAWPRMH